MPRPDDQGNMASTFTIARNPDPESRLVYLLRLPLSSGALVLKAADTWPRTAKGVLPPGRPLAGAPRGGRRSPSA